MARRSSVDALDRLYSSLPYLLPIASVVLFGRVSLFTQIPILETIFFPILKIEEILSTSIIDFISIRLVVWFSVFIFVVRNYKIKHFIRFNSIQGLLLFIIVILITVIVKLLGQISFLYFILEIILNVTFLGIVAAFLYSVFQCAMGKYAEIPVISNAAYQQTP